VDAGYKFAASHRAISTVLTGTSNVNHLAANVQAFEDPTILNDHREKFFTFELRDF
jgi:predicted aldo/keto reductase-like oxidoreductase